MSEYIHFVKDFTLRCEELMKRIDKDNNIYDLKVTGLLMVASAAINIPFERLRPVSANMTPNPSGDIEKYSEAAQQFNQLLDSNFIGSCLAPNDMSSEWLIAEPKSVEGSPETWATSFKIISRKKTVKAVLKIIRHALAHGNIFTKSGTTLVDVNVGKNKRREIQEVILISVEAEKDESNNIRYGTVDHYNCISVTPIAFEKLLRGWFGFIKNIKIYPYVINDFEEMHTDAVIG